MSIPQWHSKQLKSGAYESLGHIAWRCTKKHHNIPSTQHLAKQICWWKQESTTMGMPQLVDVLFPAAWDSCFAVSRKFAEYTYISLCFDKCAWDIWWAAKNKTTFPLSFWNITPMDELPKLWKYCSSMPHYYTTNLQEIRSPCLSE